MDACRKPLTSSRTLVLDVLHQARNVPHFPVERTFDLAELAARRAVARPRISWSLVFLKAFAIVAREHPPLRQSYVAWPWPRLIETSGSVGALAIQRQHRGEDRLCFGRFPNADQRPFPELAWHLNRYQTAPVNEVFREQVRLSHLPLPLRRLIWWWNLNLAGAKRATRLGTFSLSTLAGEGSLNRGHPSFLTSSLTYGPLDSEGRCLVTLLCDHRVFDGVQAARALADLETALRGPVAEELLTLARAKAA